MAENFWIIIPVEVQRRELDAKLIATVIAVNRGYKILLGHDQMVRRMARYLPKGILYDKSIGADGDRKVNRYHRLGYAITAMDEEATGFLPAPDHFMQTRMGDQTLGLTKRWFCISEQVREHCIRRYPQHVERFVTTGLGRTDTWRQDFSGLFAEETQKIKEDVGRFILFNSNFSVVNHARGAAFVDRQLRRQHAQHHDAETRQERLQREGLENLNAYAEMLPKLLVWFPDHKLVIRPHPSESVEFWTQRFEGNPRIVFSKGGVVTPWILASDCLVHHGCTTGVEAELMGRPQIHYAPFPDEHHDSQVAKIFSHFVHSEEELKLAISKLLVEPDYFAKSRDGLETYFASLNGKLVAEHVVDEFDELKFAGGDIPSWLEWVKFSPRNLVARYKDLSKKAKTYSIQKYEGTSVRELDSKLKIISGALGYAQSPEVSQVFEDLYLIEAR